VQAAVERVVEGKTDLRVLDAGCGSDSARAGFPVPVAFETAYVVGVDASRGALEQNALIDERIVGDLQEVDLPTPAFDVVVCWDVLEHLSDPMRAVRNIAGAVKPDGILVVGIPNVWSLKGLVTKLTPFWFHRFAYEHAFRHSQPGSGADPFPTYLRLSLGPRSLRQYVERLGFTTEVAVVYGDGSAAALRPALAAAWNVVAAIARLLSLGKLRSNEAEAAFVFRRPEPADRVGPT
jgi:SAM-dependent methyltransferase